MRSFWRLFLPAVTSVYRIHGLKCSVIIGPRSNDSFEMIHWTWLSGWLTNSVRNLSNFMCRVPHCLNSRNCCRSTFPFDRFQKWILLYGALIPSSVEKSFLKVRAINSLFLHMTFESFRLALLEFWLILTLAPDTGKNKAPTSVDWNSKLTNLFYNQ